MKGKQNNLLWEAGGVVLLIVAVSLVFWRSGQSGAARDSQVTAAPGTVTPDSYPAPAATELPPEPYPAPPTNAPITAIFGPFPTATPNPLVLTATAAPNDGTTYDILNRISLKLLPGWNAFLPRPTAAIGMATIANYSPEVLDGLDMPPRDIVTLRITTKNHPADKSFDEWLSIERSKQVSPDYGVPFGTTLTEPQPITIGKYDGVSYYSNTLNDGVWLIMYLLGPDGRIAAISIDPMNQPEGEAARTEAMQILASIDILP